jgi:hypothetical protein
MLIASDQSATTEDVSDVHDSVADQESPSTGSTGWLHLLAVLWTVVLAGITLAPALARGWMLGTYDLLATQGLTSRVGVVRHGSVANSDIMNQMVQWTSLNWTEVHHGVLPLWNPYNGLGLPLAFNWQAASFGLPSLVGYLVPLRFAYTTGVVATLIIAGTGAYFLARVLRIGFLGAITVATVFELGGPLVGWLGYPHGQVMAWGGWLFAAGVLVVRGTRPIPAIALLAVVIAFAVYSGQPETLAVMLAGMVVFLVALLVVRSLPPRIGFVRGPIRRPIRDLVIAVAAGFALGAPLLLPAIQATNGSVRATSTAPATLPFHDLTFLVFSGFDGVPVPGQVGFGLGFYYNESAAYVGIIAFVLALVAVVAGIRRRRPEVFAALAVVVVFGALAFLPPLDNLLYRVSLIREIQLMRSLMPLTLGIAILAGVGLDTVVRTPKARSVRLSLLYGFGAAALLLLAVWLFDRGGDYGGLPSSDLALAAHSRAESFIWPVVSVGVGMVGVGLLWWRSRLRLAVALILLLCETGFLVAAGSIQIASSANGFPPTPAVATLKHIVGSSIVATGQSPYDLYCPLGITANANIDYGIHEANAYDPIVPLSYYIGWGKDARTSSGLSDFNEFCPVVANASQARLIGAAFVLEPSGGRGLPGGVFVRQLKVARQPPSLADKLAVPPGNEDLYRVPGAAMATLIPLRSQSADLPRPDAPGAPVHVDDSNPARWSLTTDASTPAVLRLHLSDMPGWQATMDGRPLPLQSLADFMLQARIPPGRHVIELSYWPAAFSLGLIAALVTAIALAVALVVEAVWRRRSGSSAESWNS